MSDFITKNTNEVQIDRRGYLKCMAWAGTGVLFIVGGGTAASLGGGKRVYYCLLAATLLLGCSGLARDLTTINGDLFKDISVLSRDPTGIDIMHDDGVAFLDFKNLSEADQKDFGFDPAAYADARQRKFEAEKLRRQQAELTTLLAIARAQAQIAQANVAAPQTFRPTNQTGPQMTDDSPTFIYGGFPVWDFPNVVLSRSGRNFSAPHIGMSRGSTGLRHR